jgi:hypothetical protein
MFEVSIEPEQAIHKTIGADEDEQSSSMSSNKSSKSSEVEEIEEQETESVHQNKDTLQDTPGDNQPDDTPVTRRRTIQQPRRFVKDISAGVFETLTKAEQGYYQCLEEMGCVSLGLVGAGLGGGFQDMHKLHVIKWVKAVDKEHSCMEKFKVFKAVKKNSLPKKA